MISSIARIYKHFANDSLYRNSIYLMMSTFVGSFFGFFFWIVNTKLYTPEQIGLATALISSLSLITGFSLLGLNLGIIRYLPKAEKKTDQINTVLTIVLCSTLVVSVIYLLGLPYFSPKLLFLTQNTLFLIIFIILAVFFSLESIYNNVFIAYRNSKYVFYKSIIGNIAKVTTPLILLAFGSYAIFISSTIGSVITFFVSIFILYKLFNYKFQLVIKKDIFSKMFKLSFGNYIASFAASLPLTLLPIMITNTLGPKQAAFFYMDMAIVGLLTAIQSSIGQSLFAEGSHNDKELKKHVIKSIKFYLLIMVPAILVIVLFGKYILLFFGKDYSSEGIALLQILVLSVIFTSINSLLSAILNIKGKVNIILVMCIIGPIILLTLIYFLLPHGLISLGYAWLVGEGIISLIYLLVVYLSL